MIRHRHALGFVAVSVTASLALGGCAGGADGSTTQHAGSGYSVTTGSDLDAYEAKAAGFYSSLALEGAAQRRTYKSLEEGVKASTAVVVAEVESVGVTRTFQGESPDDVVRFVGVVIKPTEVLAGRLAPEHSARLTVEFVTVADQGANLVADLKASLPTGKAVWLLHRKGEGFTPEQAAELLQPGETAYFRTISDQGLFLQGKQGVETPLTTPSSGHDLVREAQSYRSLSQVSAAIRAVR